MGSELGKLIHLAALLVRHGEAIEADLMVLGVDLLDYYRPDSSLTVRKLWVLIHHLLLRRGSALMTSVIGERAQWTRTDEMVGRFLGHEVPEDKAVTEWKAANQARIKRLRAEHERQYGTAANNSIAK